VSDISQNVWIDKEDVVRERLEAALEWGGVKKDVACIIASAVALVVSFMSAGSLPVDSAWLAILL